MKTRLILFDIDGTLVLTGSAGIRAMNRACQDLAGHAAALTDIPVAGRTDWIILDEVARKHGKALDTALLEDLRARYLVHLREEIEQPGTGRKGVLPGIRELLDTLVSRQDVVLGLLTGNFIEGARIKLGHFDLWKYFRCGAFGDDAADRNALVPIAVRRARELGLADVPARHVLVIGDTPHDIACALAVDAMAIGVATGSHSVDSLRNSGADVVFQDLSDTRPFLELLAG